EVNDLPRLVSLGERTLSDELEVGGLPNLTGAAQNVHRRTLQIERADGRRRQARRLARKSTQMGVLRGPPRLSPPAVVTEDLLVAQHRPHDRSGRLPKRPCLYGIRMPII